MTMENIVEQTAGIIPLIGVAGLTTKMTDSMFNKNTTAQHHMRNSKTHIEHKMSKKKIEENGYTRNNAVFGSEKYRPF